MVLAGQFLERPALVACGEVTLEGLYHRGTRRPALLVCPAPGPGGGMDAAPVAELAWAAARSGLPSLRFQYRGVGASTGEPDAARALEDAEAAWRHLADTAGSRLAVAALGAGASVALALAAAHPEVERVVLVAPEPHDLRRARDERAAAGGGGARVLVVLPEERAADAPAARVAVGPAGRVEVVEGADAAFRAGLTHVGRAAVDWIGGR